MKKPTQQQLADELGVSRRTIANWKSEGVNIDAGNIDELRQRASTSKSRTELSQAIAQARLRKLEAEAAAKEHALEVERGNYVTRESQEREGLHAGQTIKQLILRIPAELPQLLVGLEFPEAVKKCEVFADHILTEISNLEAFTNEHPEN